MTTTNRGLPRSAPLNLAALVPALPAVVLPNGVERQLHPLSAQAYEMYRQLSSMTTQFQAGESVNEDDYMDLIDAILARVLPDATPDDLASFGVRVELKMAPILAAAGRVDEVVRAMQALETSAAGNEAALLPEWNPDTTSAAPSPDIATPSDKTGSTSGSVPT